MGVSLLAILPEVFLRRPRPPVGYSLKVVIDYRFRAARRQRPGDGSRTHFPFVGGIELCGTSRTFKPLADIHGITSNVICNPKPLARRLPLASPESIPHGVVCCVPMATDVSEDLSPRQRLRINPQAFPANAAQKRRQRSQTQSPLAGGRFLHRMQDLRLRPSFARVARSRATRLARHRSHNGQLRPGGTSDPHEQRSGSLVTTEEATSSNMECLAERKPADVLITHAGRHGDPEHYECL